MKMKWICFGPLHTADCRLFSVLQLLDRASPRRRRRPAMSAPEEKNENAASLQARRDPTDASHPILPSVTVSRYQRYI
jgi:hypothetical protein